MKFIIINLKRSYTVVLLASGVFIEEALEFCSRNATTKPTANVVYVRNS